MHIFLTEPNSLTNSYYLNNYHRQLFRTLTWSKAKFKALICKKNFGVGYFQWHLFVYVPIRGRLVYFCS